MRSHEYRSVSYQSSCNSIKIRWVSLFLLPDLFHNIFRPNWPPSGVQFVLRSLLCFLFDILGASTCFIQVMLSHVFVSNHVFGLCLLSMFLSFSLVLYLFCVQVNRVKYTGNTQNQAEQKEHQRK
jgi:hypothetical protein